MTDPFLKLIASEATRLADGFLVSAAHMAVVLGEEAGSAAFHAKLEAFCADAGLVARSVGDAILFVVAPKTDPTPAPAPKK